MSELIIQILSKLPIETLVALLSIITVLAGVILIPFWVKRVENRMQDVHLINNSLQNFGLRLDRHDGRLRKLEDSGELYSEKFEKIGLSLNSLELGMVSVKEDLGRIITKLNIV